MAQFEIFDSLNSTQTLACARVRSGPEEPGWILAREQTAGIGRHGKTWVGTKGNFMASRYEVMAMDVRHAPQLSFVTALAVYEMLRPLVPDTDQWMRIKWPNDVLHKGRKLCGILVQTEAVEDPDKLGVVIGIGLNLAAAPIFEGYLTCSLRDISPQAKDVDPAVLLYKLNGHLDGVLNLWREKDFSKLAAAWLERAYGRDRMLSAEHDGAKIEGRLKGIDTYGALEIQSADGKVHVIGSGEVEYGALIPAG
ncbi:MAG TPA: biotin--[acetyl-CoA-carboxylase] ligase [Asticcacaulis sp.]|nr:biotin--[acetyl-CoA-carboxylase] ligase [Asticcacaulis sp.]